MKTMRKTKSVQAIFKEFEGAKHAICAADLTERFRQEMNRTTVYRILAKLETEGMLHSFIGKDGRTWYAQTQTCSGHDHPNAHLHFQCEDCGNVKCLTDPIHIPAPSGYKVKSAQVLLIGNCGEC